MDSKYPKLPLRSESTGVFSHDCGKRHIAECCHGHYLTSFSYSDTIDNGYTTYAYNKESTGIETDMVHVTLPFDNFTATPNGIRVKYPDVNISQATHYDLLKLIFLPVKAPCVHLFDTLASCLLLSLGKLLDAGCKAYFNAKNILHLISV